MSTMEEDRRLLLRPVIDTAESLGEMEDFQNRTLRPILRLQHELLLTIFEHFAAKRKLDFSTMEKAHRRVRIQALLTRDVHLRRLLLGIVIGQFTVSEADTYCSLEAATNRRLTSLLTDRIFSHYD